MVWDQVTEREAAIKVGRSCDTKGPEGSGAGWIAR